jgi:small conductance mechanosensitive channel
MHLHETYDVFLQKTEIWLNLAIDHLPNIVVAILVFALFILFSRAITNAFKRLLLRGVENIAIVTLLSMFISRAVIVIGFFVFLKILGLETAVASLLAGAGILGLALGFAFQDLTANFISGVFIVAGEPIRVGDVVETSGYIGRVSEIRMRSVILHSLAGLHVELPSRKIIENPIVNYTRLGMRRLQINTSVSYDDDLDLVQKVAQKAIEDLQIHDPEKAIEVHFNTFGDSGIGVFVWFWIKLGEESAGVDNSTTMAIKAIKTAFDAHKITIPYPTQVQLQKSEDDKACSDLAKSSLI